MRKFTLVKDMPLTISDKEYQGYLEEWNETNYDNDPKQDKDGNIICEKQQILEGLEFMARLAKRKRDRCGTQAQS